MKTGFNHLILVLMLFSGSLFAAQAGEEVGRFMTCDYKQGGFFYWVDTTCAKIWRVKYISEGKLTWEYIGQIENAKPGDVGTYIPYRNKNGGGLFIMNTATGEGWYFFKGIGDSKLCIPLGLPSDVTENNQSKSMEKEQPAKQDK